MDDAVKISASCSFRLTVDYIFRVASADSKRFSLSWMKQALSVYVHNAESSCLTVSIRSEILIGIVTHLIQARGDSKDERLWMKMAFKMMELFCRRSQVRIAFAFLSDH